MNIDLEWGTFMTNMASSTTSMLSSFSPFITFVLGLALVGVIVPFLIDMVRGKKNIDDTRNNDV